jgi:very-short-patch-repair endonuclease
MLRKGRVTPAKLTTYLRKRRADDERNERGAGRFARVIALTDGRAESPMESRLRVRLVLAGLPTPQVQYEIRNDQGRLVARVDLAWAEKKVAAEYDGAWHAFRLDRDRQRLNAITLEKWTVVYATSKRLREDFDGLVAEIRSALSSW